MKIINVLRKNWYYLIGILVFALILFRIDIFETLTIILGLKIHYFVISALLSFPVFFLRALRWRYILLKQKIIYSIKSATSIYFATLYIGLVTPGRLGEFSKLFYLNRDGHPLSKSLFSIIFDRLFDVISLVVFTTLGMLVFSNLFNSPTLVLYAVASVIIAFIISFLMRKRLLQKVMMNVLNFLIPEKLKKLAVAAAGDFSKSLDTFSLTSFLSVTGFTVASALLYYLQAYFLVLALGISINFFYLVFAVSLAALAAALPISILGIGTRDATLIFLFSYVDVSKELTIAFSVLILFNILILALFCLPFWFKNPLPLPSLKNFKVDGK